MKGGQYTEAFCFSSHLGWMALTISLDGITDISFGWKNARQASGALGLTAAAATSTNRLYQSWLDRLSDYGKSDDDFLDLPIDLTGRTPFQTRVLTACRAIIRGETSTYGQLAAAAGSPRACRAVGNIMANNRIPLVIPCHRVLREDGGIGGYSARQGIEMKRHLLSLEGVASCA